uniref:Uncharacterized protein n=2 Tax=Nothoprocta perdicaria TaxID=30464 RepID=A0A8C7A1R5_NOTPE
MPSTLEPVSQLDDTDSNSPANKKPDKIPKMKDSSSICCAGNDADTLERESKLLPLNHDSTGTDPSHGSLAGGQEQQCVPDHGGGGDCPANIGLERTVEGAKKTGHFAGGDFDPKSNQTEQSLMEILQELREESDFMKRSTDKIYSESPYDTDCTKKLISTIHQTSSQEDLLEEIESELLSTDFSKECKCPNGVRKGEHALAVFEKCVQDKYLEQEQTIRK